MIKIESSRRLRGRGDRGVTLITFAVSLAGVLAVVAFVLGGSIGYSAERNSQTSTDAAALAATQALRDVQVTQTVTPSDYDVVFATADAVAKSNDADADEQVICQLVNVTGDPFADCQAASLSEFVNASGVHVDASDTRGTPFGAFVGDDEIEAGTGATATIQPLAEGQSPFMVCSPAEGHPSPVVQATPPYNIIDSAIGGLYVLQGTDMKNEGRDCGNPASNWRGWVNFDNTYPIPGEWEIENGNKTGFVPRKLAGDNACGGTATAVDNYVGCEIAVPLCISGNNGGGAFTLDCVSVGRFEIVWNANGPAVIDGETCSTSNAKLICGRFLGGGVATGGQGSDEEAGVNDLVVIKLFE